MKPRPGLISRGLALAVMLTACAGAGSGPVMRYHVLDSVAPSLAQVRVQGFPGLIVRVDLPPYLDRPGLVWRDDANRLHVAEYDRWGGRLRDNIARVLAGNLSARLASAAVDAAPAPYAPPGAWLLLVDVRAFERMADGRMHLRVRWRLVADDRMLAARLEDMAGRRAVAPNRRMDMVAEMNRLLARLADHVAARIRGLAGD